jgi:acyl-ACP thioesterase
MNYFDSDMFKSTNKVVYFDGKDDNLYLCLLTMSHKINAANVKQVSSG